MDYQNCKARIHSVDGVYGLNKSLVLLVCGELSINDQPLRCFLQSFILCQQTLKTYYVQTDIFQWLDESFQADNSNNESNSEEKKFLESTDKVYSLTRNVDTSFVPESLPLEKKLIETNKNEDSVSPTLENNFIENINTDNKVALDTKYVDGVNNGYNKVPSLKTETVKTWAKAVSKAPNDSIIVNKEIETQRENNVPQPNSGDYRHKNNFKNNNDNFNSGQRLSHGFQTNRGEYRSKNNYNNSNGGGTGNVASGALRPNYGRQSNRGEYRPRNHYNNPEQKKN